MRDVTRRGEGAGVTFAEWARALLGNGLGNYADAAAAAQRACADRDDPGSLLWPTAELIEAATRTGMTQAADRAWTQFDEMTRVSDTGWSLGIRARCHALLSDGGSRPFISAHTVQYHLRKILAKLSISSRSRLGSVLPSHPGRTLQRPR